jgi:putative toxin-antitoxin system antitoxin component (TIGR02293 family)
VRMPAVTLTRDDTDESLYSRVSVLLDLKPALRSEVDLIERLDKGLPVATVAALRRRITLSDAETFQLIAPRRTLSRREAQRQRLSREEADRVVRIARVAARARQALAGKPALASEWLREPKTALRGRTPMQALATEAGALMVEDLLIGIEHGMFA